MGDRRRWTIAWAAAAIAVATVGVATARTGPTGAPVAGGGTAATAPRQFVLSPEGNHLWAYDARTGEHQLLSRARNGADPGTEAPNGLVRDINGQICVSPDGRHVVTGEDTVFPVGTGTGGDGAGSHDPRVAGWGYFEIAGDALGELTVDQIGKLAPEAGQGPGYAGDPDNYGCGFLDGDRLLTTAIGNTLPGQEANGQLFLWFGPFDQGFRRETDLVAGVDFLVGEVAHCEIDGGLATAGGIAVDANGDVYVAANRPTEIPGGDPSAVWRYSGTWPRTAAECTPEFLAANITREAVIPSLPLLPVDPIAPTPSSVVLGPAGTLYVSSVFSGTVSEFTKDGTFLRDLFPLSPVAPRPGPTGDTPFGLAVTADGALWISDLGIVASAPAEGQGSLRRLAFDGGDPVVPAETIRDGLTFPDGLGVYTPPPADPADPGGPGAPDGPGGPAGPGGPGGPPSTPPGHGGPNPGHGQGPPGGDPGAGAVQATSQLACPAWSMYGRTLGREFATDCASPIDRSSVVRLVPAWTYDTARPVTATPAVVDGVVYVGSWDATMFAFDAGTGAVRWEHRSPPAPGATYGPIVSSVAVADVTAPGTATRRLVVFGSGPRVYALDAADGSEVWVHDASNGVIATPTEYESSPVVHGGLVLIGRDTHNQGVSETGGVRGGLVALDVLTGEVEWTFEPEQEQPGTGCGGIWGSPVVDPQLGYAFVGAANCPHADSTWTAYTNAVTAVDLDTGAPVWSFRPNGPPDDDTDFGATPNLFVDSTGRRVLGAGKKDGTYYALDPASGVLLWSTHVVDPAPNIGGFIGSPAVYGGDVFGGTAIGTPSYFHSLDGATGAVRWQGGIGPTYGATAVVNGVAFNAALDDLLKAYDTDTGRVLWATPLSGPGFSGPAVYGDMVFIGSGTSTSDACGKGNAYDEVCFFAFDTALATLGGVHAYRLAPVGALPPPPTFDGPRLPDLATVPSIP